MSKTVKIVIWLIVIVVVIAIGVSLSKKGGDTGTGPIKIGFIGPLTGDAANIGQNSKAAVSIAVEEINNAGGINKRPLEVIYEDGQCNGKTASNAANKLINVDKVPVILGGACSGETSAFAGASEQAKVVTLSYCSSVPTLTQAGDYIFRDYPSDIYQGKFGAEYVYNTLGKKKVAVLYVKSDWGVGVEKVFVDSFTKLGGTIVANEGYDQTSRDLRSQLTKIKATKPDLLYFLGYSDASIPGLKQAAELKLNVPMFGADGWDDSKIFTEAGKAADGIMFTVVYAPLNNDFKTKMQAKVGNNEITSCSPEAYDATKILAQVIGKVGTDSTKIKDELYKVSYTGGVSSDKIEFDQNGDLVSASYIVKVVKNGKAEPVK